MVNWQLRSRRKSTGGKRHIATKKHKRELGRFPIETKLGARVVKKQRIRGGNMKIKVYSDEYVNVNDGEKTKRVKIQDVIENPSNKDFNRRKIITCNTIVKTELGKVRVTSRPGQCSTINGILVK